MKVTEKEYYKCLMKATKLNYQMKCFIGIVMNLRIPLIEGTDGQLSNVDRNYTKILIITSSSCSAFSSVDMFFLHAIRSQNMAVLSVCFHIAHKTAIFHNPHNSSGLDIWVTNTTSAQMFSPEKKIASPYIFVTTYHV
jgi:hypothetical protein